MTDGDAAARAPVLPPLQLEQLSGPFRMGGMEIITGRMSRSPRTSRLRLRRTWLWAAAVSGADLHTGRGGFGLSEEEAIMDLFRYLRFLNARLPQLRGGGRAGAAAEPRLDVLAGERDSLAADPHPRG